MSSTLRISWAAMFVVLAALLVYGVTDPESPRTKGEQAAALATQYACPTCDGQSIAESQAPVAQNMRREIQRLVADGSTEDEIESVLVTQYGEEVLLRPRSTGLSGLVWILPVVGAVFATAGLAIVFLRWRDRPEVSASDDDRSLVAEALDERERAR